MRWIISLTLLSLTSFHSITLAQALSPERPNILFIFADDQCFDTIRSLGNDEIQTPNLDRLVRQGTTFSHAYNMGSWSGAVCIASRTMLITGRYVWNAQAVHPRTTAEREAGNLWPQLLSAAGYDTYMTGKWHINTAADGCFDVTRHVRPGMPKTVQAAYNRPVQGQPDAWSSADPSNGGFWEGGKHWSEVGADDAIDFLRMAADDEDPFMMYIAFNAPHDPRQAPQEYLDRYPLDRIEVPSNYLNDYPYAGDIGCGPGLRDEALAPFPRTEYAVQVHRKEYYALITHLDEQLGRILDELEASGQADNTIVAFTADHGLAVGHHGLMGKQNMYDHSVRVPFLMAGPGIPENHRIDAAIYLQDIVPTTLEIASARRPEHIEFHSLWPLLRGETTESAYPAVYGAYLRLQRSVTVDGWKLIVYPKAQVVRLYNLNEDPQELTDLASSPEQAKHIGALFDRLIELQGELNDDLDLSELRVDWQ